MYFHDCLVLFNSPGIAMIWKTKAARVISEVIEKEKPERTPFI